MADQKDKFGETMKLLERARKTFFLPNEIANSSTNSRRNYKRLKKRAAESTVPNVPVS
jgi:hypothetical protein